MLLNSIGRPPLLGTFRKFINRSQTKDDPTKVPLNVVGTSLPLLNARGAISEIPEFAGAN